jgi:hypothetical protein
LRATPSVSGRPAFAAIPGARIWSKFRNAYTIVPIANIVLFSSYSMLLLPDLP